MPSDPWTNRIAALALVVAVGGVIASYLQYRASLLQYEVGRQSIRASWQIANKQIAFAKQAIQDSNADTQKALAMTGQLVAASRSLASSATAQSTQARRVADSSVESSQTAIDSLNESTANFRRQLRAYVNVELNQDFTQPSANEPRLPILYSNLGASPAFKVETFSRYWFGIPGEKIPGEYEQQKEHPFSGSGGFRLSKEHVIHYLFNEAEISHFAMVQAGKETFVLELIVNYEDIYGDKHRTSYCIKMHKNNAEECGIGNDES